MKEDLRILLSKMYDDQLNWLTIRIDNHPNLEKMKEFAQELGSSKWLVGHEYKSSRVEHSHIIIGVKDKITDYRKKKLVKDFFNVEKTEFSSSWVRTTVHRTLCYSIKDGDFLSEGFARDYLVKAILQSTKKFKKDAFSEALKGIEDMYYQDIVTLREFTRLYLDLKIKQYGQRPNEKSEIAYLNTHQYKKDVDFADEYSEYIFFGLKVKNKNLGY